VVGGLLGALGRDLGHARVLRPRERPQREQVPVVEQELPRDRVGVAAVRLLDDEQVAELVGVAPERELVLVAARALDARLDLAGVAVPQPRLSDQVEPDVGERDVLLDHRPFAHPLAQPLGEHEVAVGEPQQVFEEVRVERHVPGLRCS